MNNFTAFIFGALLAIILVGYVFFNSGEKQESQPVAAHEATAVEPAKAPNESKPTNEVAAPAAEDAPKAEAPKSDDEKSVDTSASETAASTDSQSPEVQPSDDTKAKADDHATDAAPSETQADVSVDQPQAETAK